MFTNTDFLAYFSEIEMQERNMRDFYEAMLENLKEPVVRKAITYLAKAEARHLHAIGELRRMIVQKQVVS